MNKKFYLITGIAAVTGMVITWIDSRPNWDDTGITVGLILVSSLIFGLLARRKPWLIALAVGLWIPLQGIFKSQDFGLLIALIPAFIGAFVGYSLRKTTTK